MEPMPTRLAFIAMGTGDMDCVYHAALYELEEAAAESGNEDQAETLPTLVSGRRLLMKLVAVSTRTRNRKVFA